MHSTMTGPFVKFIYHGLSNLFVAYVPVAFVMLTVYGGEVIGHFDNDKCSISFMNDNDLTRDTIFGLLFGTLGSYSIMQKIFKRPDDMKVIDVGTFFFFAAVSLGIVVIIMTQYGVLTARCEDSDLDSSLNGEVKMIEMYAGIIFTLMLAFSINNMDIISHYESEGKSESPRVVLGYTSALSLTSWVIRILFAAFLLQMMSSNTFKEDHANENALGSTACLAQASKIDTDSESYKAYQRIEIAEPKYDGLTLKSVDPNQTMLNLLYSVLAALGIEGVVRLLEMYGRYAKDSGLGQSIRMVMWGNKVLAIYGEIVLAMFIYSLTMANDVAACPLLDPHKGTVQNVYWTSVVYILFGFFCTAFKEFRRDDIKDDDKMSGIGLPIGNSFYSHLSM